MGAIATTDQNFTGNPSTKPRTKPAAQHPLRTNGTGANREPAATRKPTRPQCLSKAAQGTGKSTSTTTLPGAETEAGKLVYSSRMFVLGRGSWLKPNHSDASWPTAALRSHGDGARPRRLPKQEAGNPNHRELLSTIRLHPGRDSNRRQPRSSGCVRPIGHIVAGPCSAGFSFCFCDVMATWRILNSNKIATCSA